MGKTDTLLQKAQTLRQQGKPHEAIALYQKLLGQNGTLGQGVRLQLAHTFRECGQWQEAQQCYEKVLKACPVSQSPPILLALGGVLRKQGKHDAAIAVYEKALQVAPNLPDTHNNLGNALNDMARYTEAIVHYQKAIALKPDYAIAHNGLGIAYRKTEQFQEAFEAYKMALKLDPNYVQAYVDLGLILLQFKQFEDAKLCFDEALKRDEKCAIAFEGLGLMYMFQEQPTEALIQYKKALVLNYRPASFLCNVSNCLIALAHYEEAQDYLQQAIQKAPLLPLAHHNLGVTYDKQRRYKEALASYDQAVLCQPDYAVARFNRALDWLRLEQFEQGWHEYEWRFAYDSDYSLAKLRHSAWDGHRDLQGKRILVLAEQGFGDTIQFSRYLPWLKAKGATVIMQSQPPVLPLLQAVSCIDVLLPKEPVPVDEGIEYDTFVYLLSLPPLFYAEHPKIPAPLTDLQPTPDKVQAWQSRLGHADKIKIGIVWASKADHPNARIRTCPLSAFGILNTLPSQFQLYSLQKGEPALELKQSSEFSRVIDLDTAIQDFSDTAAIIQNLDLVITVDTAVAHLAGSLNCPVWIILPYLADWRWFLNREDTPWYPSAKLFRSETPESWETVLQGIHEKVLQTFPETTSEG